MIVKDEETVIGRCLDSVRPLIDTWAIMDTGSTDRTRELVAEHLRDLPGQLVESPWVDFSHNRNEALEMARGLADYVFVIDADEVVQTAGGFTLPRLEADSYSVITWYAGCTYPRRQLLRAALPWRYRGVVHEHLECPGGGADGFIPGMWIVPHQDGARARAPDTYLRDARLLEQALRDEPDNARYVFYLAQSYRDAGEHERALEAYARRAAVGGWHEEVWYSLYQVALLLQRLERPWAQSLEAYLAAYQYAPDRPEPLFRIGLHYQGSREDDLAYLFLRRAAELPEPGLERLFVERPIHDYELPMAYSAACTAVGEHREVIATSNKLLRSDGLPPELTEQVIAGRRASLDSVAHQGPVQPAPSVTVVIGLAASPDLDDCVDSLLGQDYEDLHVVFVRAPGAAVDASRLPLEDARFELCDSPFDEEVRALAARSGEHDVLVMLRATDRVAQRESITRLALTFLDGGCVLAYGQHREADGALGDAAPARDADEFRERGPALASDSPLAFRATLVRDVQPAGAIAEVAWRAAGYARTRFLDDVLTMRAAALPLPAPASPRHNGQGPLVSCLMVTKDRVRLAKQAIRSFASQTYERRELVVVTDGQRRYVSALERYVTALGLDGVRFVQPDEPGLPLGRLRNMALDAARGDVVCQWDDDDYSHPERLERQLGHMLEERAAACLLGDHLQLLERDARLFWIDWGDELAHGSLMMRRDCGARYPEDGPFARRGEDTALLQELRERVAVTRMTGAGHLWLYTFHGANTFSEDHHRRITSLGASREFLANNAQLLQDVLASYPVPRPLLVVAPDGIAFGIR